MWWHRPTLEAEASVQRPVRTDIVDREHRVLLAAIADGDAAAAGAAARDHVLNTLTESAVVLATEDEQ